MKYSIITVNRNNAAGLEATLQSISVQTSHDFELIIIDGASTDNSVSVAHKYDNIITFLSSEPDSGIYDGMNKGISHASGDYILFLNSGDIFASKTVLSSIASETIGTPGFIFGDTIVRNHNHDLVLPLKKSLTFRFFALRTVCHQSSFIRRDIFHTIGLYDTSYRIVADWVLFMDALFKHHITYQVINIPVSVYDNLGVSSSSDKLNNEREKYLQANFPLFLEDYKLLEKFRRYTLYDIKERIKCKWFELKNRFFKS